MKAFNKHGELKTTMAGVSGFSGYSGFTGISGFSGLGYNAADSGIASLNFGAYGTNIMDTFVDVSSSTIQANSVVTISLQLAPTADHSADEALVDPPIIIAGNIQAGVGFTIYGTLQTGGYPYGVYNIYWSWR